MLLASLTDLALLIGVLDQNGVFVNKAIHGFRFLDLNKDGYLTAKEYSDIADFVCTLSNTTAMNCNNTKKQWTKFSDALPGGRDTMVHFLQFNVKFHDRYPDLIYQEILICYFDVFDKLDSDKDGVGSPEEIRRYYALFGYGDDYDIDDIYRSIDVDDDDQISRNEFATAAAVYWSNEPGYENFFNPMLKENEV